MEELKKFKITILEEEVSVYLRDMGINIPLLSSTQSITLPSFELEIEEWVYEDDETFNDEEETVKRLVEEYLDEHYGDELGRFILETELSNGEHYEIEVV